MNIPNEEEISEIFIKIAFEAKLLDQNSLSLHNLRINYDHLSSSLTLNKSKSDSFLGVEPLTVLPVSIGELKHLQSLDISIQKLTFLPDSICNLQKLVYLNLDFNHLHSLPKNFGDLHTLQFLYLSYNKLETLPDSITKLDQLRELKLEGNNTIFSKNQEVWLLKLRENNCEIWL